MTFNMSTVNIYEFHLENNINKKGSCDAHIYKYRNITVDVTCKNIPEGIAILRSWSFSITRGRNLINLKRSKRRLHRTMWECEMLWNELKCFSISVKFQKNVFESTIKCYKAAHAYKNDFWNNPLNYVQSRLS